MLRARMGDAYTPGLTVTGNAVVRKLRRLPLPGEVLAKVGQKVTASDVVARTELPGRVHLLNFSNLLGVLPDEIAGKLRVEPGAAIREGDILAESKSLFGLLTSRVKAPITGTFESVSEVTGQAVMREPPTPVEVTAYMDGQVVEEIPTEGAIIETRGALIQGIFGLSGEVYAPIVMVSDDPGQVLSPGDLDEATCHGKVVVGGSLATVEVMRRAIDIGVAAVVVGGFAYQDIRELLGYDVGVAVTGTENLGTTLVVTEGFGQIAMAGATFALLREHEGEHASVNGATQIRAGVIRPEVVIPNPPGREAAARADQPGAGGLEIGAKVRCIRAPHFGRIGEVTQLPTDLMEMPSETRVRVLEVTFGQRDAAIIPRANVEVIER